MKKSILSVIWVLLAVTVTAQETDIQGTESAAQVTERNISIDESTILTPERDNLMVEPLSDSVLAISTGALPQSEEIASITFPPKKTRFLPMHRRIDRGINQGRFAYKGELIAGLTASYGTMSNDDTDFLVIFDNIDLDGTVASVKPFIGYFYRNNRCIGVRFGYQHVGGKLGNLDFDLGDQNDITMNISGMELTNDSYSFGIFHRSYVGLDPRGRFGLFAEVEASMTTGTSDFINGSGETAKATYSDNFKMELAFNPGLAVYLFPNVCTTVSIGLGGIQYSSVNQSDADGNKIGSRTSSKMRFRLNIANINFGIVVHFWDHKKR